MRKIFLLSCLLPIPALAAARSLGWQKYTVSSLSLSPEAKRRLAEMNVIIWIWSKDRKSRFEVDTAKMRTAFGLATDDVRAAVALRRIRTRIEARHGLLRAENVPEVAADATNLSGRNSRGLRMSNLRVTAAADMTQFEGAIRQSAGNPFAGLTARQSVNAQLNRQPTPESLHQAKECLKSQFSAAMARAKRYDAQANRSSCTRALNAAKQMYIL
jgi:hypothetical protein